MSKIEEIKVWFRINRNEVWQLFWILVVIVCFIGLTVTAINWVSMLNYCLKTYGSTPFQDIPGECVRYFTR